MQVAEATLPNIDAYLGSAIATFSSKLFQALLLRDKKEGEAMKYPWDDV